MPTGTPMMMAPAVPKMLDEMNGMMPNCGLLPVGCHVVPKRKSARPISRIAGMPAMTK